MSSIIEDLGISKSNIGIGFGNYKFKTKGLPPIDSFNPANEKLIASVTPCDISDYKELLVHAAKSSKIWKNVPAPMRGEIIRQIGEELRLNKDALGKLVTLEVGKSLQEGLGEVQEMIDIADFAVGQSRMLYGLTMHSERPEHRMYEQWHPYGIIGIISAFNFPVAVWAWNAFIAAICGNISIWKPSEKAPLTCIAIFNICNTVLARNDMPPIFGYFIPENHDISKAFLEDSKLPLISFTGSTKTGRYVSETVAKRFGKSLVELGGNNALIVDEMANLDNAINSIVFGSVGTAGQRCTSTRRVFIHHKHYEEVVTRLVKAYKQVKIATH